MSPRRKAAWPWPAIPQRYAAPLGDVVVVARARVMNGTQRCNGLWDSDARRITLDRALGPEAALSTFLHERAHQVLDDAQVQFPTTALEESVCWAFAAGWREVARDVPFPSE